MKLWSFFFLVLCYPFCALADSSLSLTPPSTDYSVIFLGNIFGVVDGVLHGTGSQIMGKMFGVFNAAVLALGGIVVTYTLIVGTMNTSHEGQFLGQKWSSIWIPVRSTIGLALLIPKASGYCLMQIFIMWVVVQGVGAADKIWSAALDYLNLGGVIVGAQSNVNSTDSSKNNAVETIATGESRILMGQVCMRGLQIALQNARASYLEDKESGSGPCLESKTATDTNMDYFCNTSVPDFLATVNIVDQSNQGKNSVAMPYFQDSSVYVSLNGVCGTIKWNKLDVASQTASLDYVSTDDVDTLNQSRAIALQQMYMDLSPLALSMVNNDPQLNTSNTGDTSSRYSAIAQDQYGMPLLSTTQALCQSPSSDCMGWGPAPSINTQVFILTGLEFINAMTDYNAIMMPVLNLLSQSSDASLNNSYHEFISTAESSGWIMAGTYFFDLANINGSVQSHTNTVDTDSGLDAVTAYSDTMNNLTGPFNNNSGDYAILYTLFNKDITYVTAINNLITGASVQDNLQPNVGAAGHAGTDKLGSSSTYGYVNNASLIHLPGQPGLVEPSFGLSFNISFLGNGGLSIPHKNFACGGIAPFCIGRALGNLLWNTVIASIVNLFLDLIRSLFSIVVQSLIYLPLTRMMTILNNGVQQLATTQSHPIVAMAFMGTSFINCVTELYFQMLAISALFSLGGGIIFMMVLPFISAFMAIMFTVGFIDAYYVPFLPYMIFTFGSIAWLMAVVESMVAGPVVALGVTHPEGHDALGKAEQAIMILVNVFLRPAMMIIGYIAGIALCYVSVFIINSGFAHVMRFLMPNGETGSATIGTADTPYTSYASMYAGFFCLLTYTTIYLTVVEKSFTLIYLLPDNVLRWIGGTPEQIGKETAQWADATKKQIEEGGREVGKAGMKSSEELGQHLAKMVARQKPEEENNIKAK